MLFTNKTIWILSPEVWGVLKVSKHHYALELAKKGNQVYFFEIPQLSESYRGSIVNIEEGVKIFKYKPLARGKRFLGKNVYCLIQKLQFWFIRKVHHNAPDIIWCFDAGNYDDLNIFSAKLKIFHAVDHSLERETPHCATTADVIFSTSFRILDYMRPEGKPGKVINHGLNIEFEHLAERQKLSLKNKDYPIKPFNNTVGFWGSLFKESMDRKKILKLINSFPELTFIFFGPYMLSQNNLGGKNDQEVFDFLEQLKSRSNVILKGPRKASELVNELNGIDFFINIEFEYSTRWDNGNPHKVLEYLATGKPVFSTSMVMYEGSDLFCFYNNGDIFSAFQDFIANLEFWITPVQQEKRLTFALENTYQKQIKRIEEFINKV